MEVVKNNDTKVEELVNFIKTMDTSNKDEFAKKFNELKEATEQRNNDLDKRNNEFESKMEIKLAEMVDRITKSFPQNVQIKKEEKKFKSFGDFLQKVKHRTDEVKDLAEGAGNTGGYLVPEEFRNEILRVTLETGVMRSSGARVIPMASNIVKIPALNMASNAAGSLYGGVAAYWGAENSSLTESQPDFKKVTLEAKKLIAYTEAPEELNEDSITSLGTLLSDMFGEVVAFEEDYAFLVGDGVGKPLGITQSPAFITVSRASGSVVVTADIVAMIARFKGNLARAKWIVNQSALPYIYKLMDDNDNFIWHPSGSGDISTSAPGTLYGIPIKISEKVPALGTTGDVMLVDPGYYLIGDRSDIRIENSMHFKFQNDQEVWRIVKRVDGQPWLDSAITPRAGGSTLSPFIGIG
jgi:HK97 family phage major capsid protein